MKENGITELVQTSAAVFDVMEERIKYGFSLLKRLGMEGEPLSNLLARCPGIVASLKENEKINVERDINENIKEEV